MQIHRVLRVFSTIFFVTQNGLYHWSVEPVWTKDGLYHWSVEPVWTKKSESERVQMVPSESEWCTLGNEFQVTSGYPVLLEFESSLGRFQTASGATLGSLWTNSETYLYICGALWGPSFK